MEKITRTIEVPYLPELSIAVHPLFLEANSQSSQLENAKLHPAIWEEYKCVLRDFFTVDRPIVLCEFEGRAEYALNFIRSVNQKSSVYWFETGQWGPYSPDGSKLDRLVDFLDLANTKTLHFAGGYHTPQQKTSRGCLGTVVSDLENVDASFHLDPKNVFTYPLNAEKNWDPL